ncbi:hypothetical protein D8B26_001619 [Coccidioides posadasii str. Silveira]|uniref:uncharacterized protein n=1 Tax=Coccidioides posadasii (strain RMSCC 757 / Silveira) TaxID=443226 RepID=UPI001BF0FE1A|nr:hypothetical protein D8B26_001619 [Coccidioides posadasii str. Silveira]
MWCLCRVVTDWYQSTAPRWVPATDRGSAAMNSKEGRSQCHGISLDSTIRRRACALPVASALLRVVVGRCPATCLQSNFYPD